MQFVWEVPTLDLIDSFMATARYIESFGNYHYILNLVGFQ